MKAKNFISLILVFAMITSLVCMPVSVFADDEIISEVVYDLAGKEYTLGGTTSRYPVTDDAAADSAAVEFRNRSNTKIDTIDSKSVVKYSKTTQNTYIRWYATHDKSSVSNGRLVFTGRYYANTTEVSGTFTIARDVDGYECETKLWNANNAPKANTWYTFKFVVDMDRSKNNVSYKFIEENPLSSAEPHVLSKVDTYTGESFNNIWADIDIASAAPDGSYCAYTDFKLTYNTHASYVDAISNGSHNSPTYDKGIFSALANGSGLFAIALYKDDELVKISFSETDEELTDRRLNMMIDEIDGTSMKIFRFDADGTPVAVNKELKPQEKNYTVYINETFDTKPISAGAQPNGSTKVLSDGRMYVSGTSYVGTLPINYPENNIIISADFTLPDGQSCFDAKLLTVDGGGSFARMRTDGIRDGDGGGNKSNIVIENEQIEKDRTFNLAVKLDIELGKAELYYNKEFVCEMVKPVTRKGFSIYAPRLVESGNAIYVDNIKAYSGTDWLDIGNERPTSHRYSYNSEGIAPSEIYERPEAEWIASKVVDSPRPRIIMNRDRFNKIKNSTDPEIIAMRENAIKMADSYIDMPTYTYETSDDSFSNMDNAMTLMMNLGMAYLLTGNEKYPQRAYKEAEKLFEAKGNHETNDGGADYWNSYSYLDVGEACTIMSICYDWMYDGFTPDQRKALEKNTIEKGILRGFRSIYSEYNPTMHGAHNFSQAGNWGAVCNGGVMLASIAFMESDPFMCSQMAEANIRAIETTLASFAPTGAWSEGVGYWSYTLKNFTLMCATLDSALGSTFGLEKAEGFKNSQYFSIASEGKVDSVNYGDKGSGRTNAPFLFYWAKKFNDSEIGGLAEYIKDEYKFNYSIYDLVYYDPAYIHEDGYKKPQFFYFSGDDVEQVTMDGSSTSDGTFISMAGGIGKSSNHDHLDSGSIILDMGGLRLIHDSGAGNYNSPLYFSTSRYYYYKTRPEGHNVFVINPQVLSDASGNFYHGQSMAAVSSITPDKDKKKATIDLSEAYGRDAEEAYRTIRLDGDKVIIEDEITLTSDGNLVEWYYHYKDVISYQYINSRNKVVNAYKPASYGRDTGAPYCEVTSDGNALYITLRDYTQNGSEINMGNTIRKYKFTFESDTNTPFEIQIRDAVRNLYDAEIVDTMRKTGATNDKGEPILDNDGKQIKQLGVDYRGYDDADYAAAGKSYPLNKIVSVMKGVSGTVKLRTIIEYLGTSTINQ